jgi:phosphomannomutase
LDLGFSGNKEMYWSKTGFGARAPIEVTASNNSNSYNGIKIVKTGSRPLYEFKDFQKITALVGKLIYMRNPQRVTNLMTLRFPIHCIFAIPENYKVVHQKPCPPKTQRRNT